MSDHVDRDDARRAALLAKVNAHNDDAPVRPSNPYAHALGWIGSILLTIGAITMLVAGGHLNDDVGDRGLPGLIVGGIITGFGLLGIFLLLAAQLIRWTPREPHG